MTQQRIDSDQRRFRQIVQGKLRRNLKEYIEQGELIGRQGKDTVSIPVPQINLPRFKYGQRENGGMGQGDGEVGDAIGEGEGQPGSGPGEASDSPGEHILEVEVPMADLAQILGEALELPNIEPKGTARYESAKTKYTGIRSVGPDSLKHGRRTFKRALKRQIAAGTYDPKRPVIIPIREDFVYRAQKEDTKPHHNAVILYMMDVSGSMGDAQKEIVRIESFWIDTWLRSQFTDIESRFIIHDASAKEVDRDTFFRTRESGGTMISSAYELCMDIIEADYPVAQWNIYPFHFSDGDNWSTDDTAKCMSLVRDRLMPASNAFCYGQVESPYGSGQFIKDLRKNFGDEDAVILSEIKGKSGIVQSIKDFLGAGR